MKRRQALCFLIVTLHFFGILAFIQDALLCLDMGGVSSEETFPSFPHWLPHLPLCFVAIHHHADDFPNIVLPQMSFCVYYVTGWSTGERNASL